MGVLTYFKKAGPALIVAVGISLSYAPNARSQHIELTEEAAEILKHKSKEVLEKGIEAIVGFNRIAANAASKLSGLEKLGSEYLRQEVKKETARMMLEGYGLETFYLEDKCYLPAEDIKKLLEEKPDQVLAALRKWEQPPNSQSTNSKTMLPKPGDKYNPKQSGSLIYDLREKFDGGTITPEEMIRPAVEIRRDFTKKELYDAKYRVNEALERLKEARKALRKALEEIGKAKKR